MKIDKDILKEADRYIREYGLDCSPEELFIEFQRITKLHEEFEEYLKSTPHHQRLNNMKHRSKRMLEKRRLFYEWYIETNQDSFVKEVIHDLAEMTFTTGRTVYSSLVS